MTKNDFRVTSIFKITLGFVGVTRLGCNQLLLYVQNYYQQVCLITYVENEIFNSSSHKKKRVREE